MKFLLLILSFTSIFQASAQVCEKSYTREAPFMVSDATGMGNKTYENLRGKSNYRKKENVLPRRSIVRIKKGGEEFLKAPNSYVPVEVLSVPDTTKLDANLKKSRFSKFRNASADRNNRRLKKAFVGKKGYIYNKSLKKSSKYTYILKEDSPLIQQNGLEGKGVVAIRPKVVSGSYEITKCCNNSERLNCSINYNFESILANNEVVGDISIDVNSCSVVRGLVPFSNKQFLPIMNILQTGLDHDKKMKISDVELLTKDNLVKVPLKYPSTDNRGFDGPYGSYHYHADDRGSNDVFMKPTSNCAFMKVLKRHSEDCKEDGCQLQFGNAYHHKSWGDHTSHGSGECIDIRPLKKWHDKLSTNIWSATYDREKTKKLIQLLIRAGATKVFFNDSKIKVPGRRWVKGHHNHIHACFKQTDRRVKKACQEGL